MNLKKKKKGFTLIELMAVIAIIAILAAVLVPTVSGYITRSKKTAMITQIRTLVNAVESYNATSATAIAGDEDLGNVNTANTPAYKLAVAELIATDGSDIDKLAENIDIDTYVEINSNPDALNEITYDKDAKVFEYGEYTISTAVN